MRPRPLPVTVAAILLALLSLLALLGPFLPGSEGVPAFCIALGVVGLLAAAGVWMLKRRWGMWLAIVVCVVNLLSAAPAIPLAPNAALRVAATAVVVVSALIVALVVLPTSRRAFAAS